MAWIAEAWTLQAALVLQLFLQGCCMVMVSWRAACIASVSSVAGEMEALDSTWHAEQEADDGEDLMLLVHQPDHLDALATGSQLQSLSLCVYQTGLGGSSRVQLNPLLALTRLRSLDVAYRGASERWCMHSWTEVHCRGDSPAPPSPHIPAVLQRARPHKRLSGSSLALVARCSSIRALRIEAGRRGLSAVAAEHLAHLGSMTQLSSISISLSKGGQSASKSAAQLLELQIPGLKGFAVGSGDHRVGFSTEQLQGMAQQWPRLESLRLSSFSPLQGLAGEEGVCGRVLHAPSALQLEHVQAVADACSSRLQHLSLNMRASSIGSKALELIAQLQQLTSLQLLGTTVATLAGPPAWQALQSMQGLRWLSVQAAEEAAVTQRPLELCQYLWNGVEALTALQELRMWLGFGVEGRQAQQQLVGRVEAKLHDCRPRQLLDICELCRCLAGRLACRVILLGGMIMTIMHVLSLLDY
ncbi:hypothetical protein COO60DRAFT_1625218 [Scenedesmus sp. NREL 46B-D3]|nr:hypothetical protein COO60DRAFT_1625218 [Scenedesmus sp. NREL 46B-D3]